MFLIFLLIHLLYASPAPPFGTSIPLTRRDQPTKDAAYFQYIRDSLSLKYGGATHHGRRKRSQQGENQLIDLSADSSYVGSIAVGNPATSFQVILDTGSADLWLAGSQCFQGCGNVPSFDARSSTSFTNLSTPFQITYATGAASGNLGSDTVQMAGFGISNQAFGVCNQITTGLLKSPISGIMGLAFSTLSTSKTMPFWETLASTNIWTEPLMAFHLTSFNGVSGTSTLQYGGSFDLGFTNTSLYTGTINYVDIADGEESFWQIPLTQITVQGQTLAVSGSVPAAIDTGTTLVTGPSDAIAAIFAQIPGSQQAGSEYEGYWAYPCDTEVTISLTFGSGQAWNVSPSNFELSRVGGGYCLGAFIELELSGTNTPSWIIGDTFLKNVYSVFRYNPPSVGFASLSSAALSQSSLNAPLPSPSIGTGSIISAGEVGGHWVSVGVVVVAVVVGFGTVIL